MKIKKFDQINEENSFINYYKFAIDNKFYYGVAKPGGNPMVFDAYGELVGDDTFSDETIEQNKDTLIQIDHKDLPKEVIDALEAFQPLEDELEDGLGALRGEIEKDEMLQPKERTYADMSQKELNDLLNQAIDNSDFSTAQEISQFMGESKIFKFNEELDLTEQDIKGGVTQEEYDEIVNFIWEMKGNLDLEVITDEEKALSEVLYMIIKHPFDRKLDYDTHYHRRLGFIKSNKNEKD